MLYNAQFENFNTDFFGTYAPMLFSHEVVREEEVHSSQRSRDEESKQREPLAAEPL